MCSWKNHITSLANGTHTADTHADKEAILHFFYDNLGCLMIGAFYKSVWSVIKDDVVKDLNAFYLTDGHAFCYLNDALLVLIPKKADTSSPKDYVRFSFLET